jgi:murein DD-endopeptidase / murein LD-carboxypeptidase
MQLVLAGAALLIVLTGCQSGHHASPQQQQQQPIAAPVQPQKGISPAQWKAEADRWLGMKYRKGGIDCWGLTSVMYLELAGISLPRASEEQYRCGKQVPLNDVRPGDLVFFISLSQRVIDHVGVYLGDTQFVHASPSKGVVVSSLRQDYYATRFHSAKRIIP